jgi:hypothetical protein
MLERTWRPSSTTAAAVSSQEVSMARRRTFGSLFYCAVEPATGAPKQ